MIDNTKEYIVCAAIWYDDGIKHEFAPRNIESGFVVCGLRHHNCLDIVSMIRKNFEDWKITNKNQGFLTSKDRFVDRKDAYLIASEYIDQFHQVNRLFSEDLY